MAQVDRVSNWGPVTGTVVRPKCAHALAAEHSGPPHSADVKE